MPAKPRTDPRKKAVQERSKATVDVILRATARILVKHGYDHASTNRIAAAAGVSVGSLYQYFPSKEALVAALLDEHMNELGAVLRAEFPRLLTASIGEAAERAVRLMVTAHSVDPKLHKVLVEQVPRVAGMERISDVEREMTGLVRVFLEAHRSEIIVTDLELSSFIVVGIVESLTHAAVLTRPEVLGEAFIREVAAVIVRYLTGNSR
jgi:AcrR family transcriptional regulator